MKAKSFLSKSQISLIRRKTVYFPKLYVNHSLVKGEHWKLKITNVVAISMKL